MYFTDTILLFYFIHAQQEKPKNSKKKIIISSTPTLEEHILHRSKVSDSTNVRATLGHVPDPSEWVTLFFSLILNSEIFDMQIGYIKPRDKS